MKKERQEIYEEVISLIKEEIKKAKKNGDKERVLSLEDLLRIERALNKQSNQRMK